MFLTKLCRLICEPPGPMTSGRQRRAGRRHGADILLTYTLEPCGDQDNGFGVLFNWKATESIRCGPWPTGPSLGGRPLR